MTDIVNKNRVYWADERFANFGSYIAVPAGRKVGDILGEKFMQSIDSHLFLMGEYDTIEEAEAAAVKYARADRRKYSIQQADCAISALNADGEFIIDEFI